MLDQSLIAFEDLNELLKSIDEFIELHEEALQRYGDRLGSLLRTTGKGEAGAQSISGGALQQQSIGKESSGQKKKALSEKEPWTVFKLDSEGMVTLRVSNPANLSPLSAENALLFRIIDALKVKLSNLQTARAAISDLPSLGYRANQRFLVAFADGLPKQVIPTEQSYSGSGRFKFAEEFVIGPLDEAFE